VRGLGESQPDLGDMLVIALSRDSGCRKWRYSNDDHMVFNAKRGKVEVSLTQLKISSLPWQ
jgi:hypothetical protein